MKFYFFLSDIQTEQREYFLDKLLLLEKGYTCNMIVEKYFYKIGEDNKDTINFSFFGETLMFIEFFKNKYNLDYKSLLKKIIWVTNEKNFFILNGEIYIENDENNDYEKISLRKKVYFITSRDTWLNPFFFFLYKLSNIYINLYVIRPNKREGWIYNDDKITNLSKLFDKKLKLIGDFVVPLIYKRDDKSIKLLLDFINNKIGRYVAIKQNSSQCGEGVKMVDLLKITFDNLQEIKKNYLYNGYGSTYSSYIVPYYPNINKEYRVYFINDKVDGKVKIYAIKNRTNIIEGSVFDKENFSIYDDIDVKWKYIDREIFIKNKNLKTFIKKVANKLNYDKGVIEFFELNNKKLIYSEYNSLGASLMFKEDQGNMIEYFKEIYKVTIKNNNIKI